jgi:beta-1,4-mannosyl-glycoprotein beta-1,4-N-acetylglucosaminyltransferase
MIHDFFPFFCELEILKIRLTELWPVVGCFHLVESTRTHKGDLKPLYFEENRAQFAQWSSRIDHIVVDDMPSQASFNVEPANMFDDPAWKREWFQMDRAMSRLNIGDTESLIYTDVDEIPTSESVSQFTVNDKCVTFELPEYHYKLNWKLPRTKFESCMVIGHALRNRKRSEIRHQHNGFTRNRGIKNAGWHFSSMGGPQFVKRKLESFCHWNRPGILEGVRNVDKGSPIETLLAKGEAVKVPIDHTYPKYVRENLDDLCAKGYLDLPLI